MAKKKVSKGKTQLPTKIKKVTRRRRKISSEPIDASCIADLDQVYRAINRVQMTRENVVFIVNDNETVIVDNILKDLALPFKKTSKKVQKIPCQEYSVDPGEPQPLECDFEDMDEFPDELFEDGQINFD